MTVCRPGGLVAQRPWMFGQDLKSSHLIFHSMREQDSGHIEASVSGVTAWCPVSLFQIKKAVIDSSSNSKPTLLPPS